METTLGTVKQNDVHIVLRAVMALLMQREELSRYDDEIGAVSTEQFLDDLKDLVPADLRDEVQEVIDVFQKGAPSQFGVRHLPRQQDEQNLPLSTLRYPYF